MARTTIHALIALTGALLLLLYLVLSPAESGDGSGGASSPDRPAAAGGVDRPPERAPSKRPGGPQGEAARLADNAPAAGDASLPTASIAPVPEPEPAIEGEWESSSAGSSAYEPSTEAAVEPGSAGTTAQDSLAFLAPSAGRRAANDAPPTPETALTPDAAEQPLVEPDPTEEPQQPNELEGVLSAEEIDRRVETILPDGSMPDDQLALAREAEAKRILEKSKIAARYTSQGGTRRAD